MVIPEQPAEPGLPAAAPLLHVSLPLPALCQPLPPYVWQPATGGSRLLVDGQLIAIFDCMYRLS